MNKAKTTLPRSASLAPPTNAHHAANLKSQFVTSSYEDNRSHIVTGLPHGGHRELPLSPSPKG